MTLREQAHSEKRAKSFNHMQRLDFLSRQPTLHVAIAASTHHGRPLQPRAAADGKGHPQYHIWRPAARNFLQHCLDGYYNNTVFHRLVPGFIVQGGDPTGTGSGGISAINNGDAFEDEFHTRLKFNRRGLLGMANEGPNTNGSQFFFTLGATPELQGKNTMFGRIEGDTIYNLMKMADTELVGLEAGS